ncbi:hypothetical protein M9Y10_000024 [Tritrichomonas musculus]|uniref:Uncharacterized protein n=1 Tax=Tritrichomonas musculus TaxID=1915356 RepID=A0ABR2L483_9EUKA
MNDFYDTNDYSDYESNIDTNNESSDDEIDPLIDVNNLSNVLPTNEEANVSLVKSPDEIDHLSIPVETFNEQNKDQRKVKKYSHADIIKELVRIYSNNSLITGNDKWIHDCKNDAELANKINDEIEQLIKDKKRVSSCYILNDEHINFFMNNHSLCETIDDILDLFYYHFGIHDTYIHTNHLYFNNINKDYNLMSDVKNWLNGLIFMLERFISINYSNATFHFKISPALNASTKYSHDLFNNNFEYYTKNQERIYEKRGSPPTGPNGEVYQVLVKLWYSSVDSLILPSLWSPLSKEITIKDKPTVYNAVLEETQYSNVKLIKLYNDVLDERIQRLFNHYIENCYEDPSIYVVVVFGYDEDKDQFFIYSSNDAPYDKGYNYQYFQSSAKFQEAVNFSKRLYLSNEKHKGQIHPYCYENVKQYLAQYNIELLNEEPKPTEYWYALKYVKFYFGSKLRIKQPRYLKKFFEKHGTIDYIDVSEIFENAEIEKFGYEIELTLKNEDIELIDNDPSCQMFWFKIGGNEFEATYDEWVNHSIPNFELIKKVVTALKNENCVIISEFINESTPFIYLYNNKEYEITWKKWRDCVRPHKNNRLTHENVKQILANENCELISTYKNLKSVITYIYDGQQYSVRFDHWKNRHQRPHLK